MTINVVNPFKSQTVRTFDKGRIGEDVHAGVRFPSAGVRPHSGKKIFKFGTTATLVDDNLSKPTPLEHVKAAQPSSFLNVCADIHVERRRKILSKVKSVKSNITRLLKPTGRVSQTAAVPCIDPLAIPSVEHSTTNDNSSSPSSPSSLSIPQYVKPEARMVTAYESTPPRDMSVDTAVSVAFGGNIVDERIEDSSATFSYGLGVASSPSSTGQLFTTPESQLDAFPSMFSLGELHTIEEEDECTEFVVGVVNTEQTKMSSSHGSWSIGDSAVTVCLSSDTLSDHTTTNRAGLVSSETNTSPVDTSFATSVDTGDSHQFSPAHRGLRRIPSYEDLRAFADRDPSCPDMSSDCDCSYGTTSGINATPLRRPRKCDNLRKSFLSLEPRVYTPSPHQMSKYRKFRAWLGTRCHESPPRSTWKTYPSRAPSESLKTTPVSRSRQFLQGILCPSRRVQAHVFNLPPHQRCQPQLLPPSSLPVWSCAKITRSSSKLKRRRRMTKQAMKELRARLDSMDIDPWD